MNEDRLQFQRTENLIGEKNSNKLEKAKVIVLGVGGVGGHICEALARAGLGTIDIVDKDKVDITNINRQIIALWDTVGQAKVAVMRERMLSINPNLSCKAFEKFYLPENAREIDFAGYDYVVDAVDNVTAKIEIISRAKALGLKVISAMGAGNKLEPAMFKVADIEKTKVCPLAKVVRTELRKRGLRDVKVVYSEEEPRKRMDSEGRPDRTPASISFVPAVMGLIMAGEVVKDIIASE